MTLQEWKEREYQRAVVRDYEAMLEFLTAKTPFRNLADAHEFLREHPEAASKPDYWYLDDPMFADFDFTYERKARGKTKR